MISREAIEPNTIIFYPYRSINYERRNSTVEQRFARPPFYRRTLAPIAFRTVVTFTINGSNSGGLKELSWAEEATDRAGRQREAKSSVFRSVWRDFRRSIAVALAYSKRFKGRLFQEREEAMDQHARTPKRKRRRMESTTPGSGSQGRRTPGSAGGESTIVWKDSPVDKQIRVSGTGKYVASHPESLMSRAGLNWRCA